MNEYSLTELEPGMRESFSVVVDSHMLDAFEAMSGDTNPLHCDEAYARRCGYDGRVAYGLLTSSFYSTLVGVHLPGRRCLLSGIDARFRLPVYPGDVLTVYGEISMIREELGFVEVRAWIDNQEGKKVSTAKLQLFVREGA